MRRLCGYQGRSVGAVVGLVLLATACTGGGESGAASPSSTVLPTPTSSYKQGEYRPDTSNELCRSVSTRTVRQLGMKAPSIGYDDYERRCRWSERSEQGSVDRELSLRHRVYEPPETRRDFSATEEATHRFRRIDGWEVRGTSQVEGLGDEAKMARALDPTRRRSQVWLGVRHRNVVLDVRVEVESYEAKVRGMPSQDTLEKAALSAVRDALGELTGKPVPAPSTTVKDQPGEVTEVDDVCGAITSAGRLVPGRRGADTSGRGSTRTGGCVWEGSDYAPELAVVVEAISPSELDGETGTQVAKQLFYGNYGVRLDERGLGDEAKIDRFSFRSGESRTIEVFVRKGNLLVSVEYERWQHPSKRQMERDVIGVAKDVLAEYR